MIHIVVHNLNIYYIDVRWHVYSLLLKCRPTSNTSFSRLFGSWGAPGIVLTPPGRPPSLRLPALPVRREQDSSLTCSSQGRSDTLRKAVDLRPLKIDVRIWSCQRGGLKDLHTRRNTSFVQLAKWKDITITVGVVDTGTEEMYPSLAVCMSLGLGNM